MNLNSAPFDHIASGKKTFELRLFDEKRQLIEVGDEIQFVNTDDAQSILNCKVIALHRFDSFEQLYKELPLLKCGYTEEDIERASPSDMNMYYPAERIKKYGVLAIELELM